MSDLLTRREPIPAEAFTGNQVVIRAAPVMARFSLRARNVADISAVLGVEAPAKIGATAHGVACLGPDEWMYRVAPDARPPVASGKLVAVTDISHRNTAIVVEGPRAAEVLSAGCPLDLTKFDIGRATRTIFETVEIIVEREASDRFHVEVWRSFAPWLWTAITQVAAE